MPPTAKDAGKHEFLLPYHSAQGRHEDGQKKNVFAVCISDLPLSDPSLGPACKWLWTNDGRWCWTNVGFGWDPRSQVWWHLLVPRLGANTGLFTVDSKGVECFGDPPCRREKYIMDVFQKKKIVCLIGNWQEATKLQQIQPQGILLLVETIRITLKNGWNTAIFWFIYYQYNFCKGGRLD